MSALLDGISWVAIIAGSLFCVIGGIGLLRLPDFYSRMHASGITDTLGAGLVLAGLMLQSGLSPTTVKLVCIALFLLFTSPTAGHALAHAARSRGLEPWTSEGDRSSPRK